MAGQKTEQPTVKHLRDARAEGQVAKSREIPAALAVLAVFSFVWIGYDWISGEFESLLLLAIAGIEQPFPDAATILARAAIRVAATVLIPCLALAAVAGTAGHLVQTGVLFAFTPVTPKLDRLHPKQWFGRVFSIGNLVELLRSVVKIAAIAAVFYLVFADSLPFLLRLADQGMPGVDTALRRVMRNAAAYSLAVFAVVAVLDWLFQRHRFIREHMMSREEVKREFKEMEGDPLIKDRRKQLHRELAAGGQLEGVRKADVLVTNPTHFAIAIQYREAETPLPLILAKGEGALAEKMMKAAEEAGVPIVRNVSLARDLWDQGRELEYVPSPLIEPVAEVLAQVRDGRGRVRSSGPV